MDLPTFRYLDDAVKLVDKISDKVSELNKLFKLKVQLKAEEEEYSILYKPKKKDQKLIPESTKVKIPNKDKLKSQYAVLEELNDQYLALDSIGAQIKVQFHDNRDLKKAENEINAVKEKIQKQMMEIFKFLSQVAKDNVPESFQTYVNAVNYQLSNNVSFAESRQFLYVSISNSGSLVFTNYTVLIDAANMDGELATLYVAVQWDMGTKDSKSKIEVYLEHDFELPNRLSKTGGGTEVRTVKDASRAIADLLNIENFSSSLGIVPLSLQLRMDPSLLKKSMFSYPEYIDKVTTSDSGTYIDFITRADAGITDENAQMIAAQLMSELKGVAKKSHDIRMSSKISKGKSGKYRIRIFFRGLAKEDQLDTYDLEFLRDRFGLKEAQVRRIAYIINKGSE